jgi:hypothetical protein
MYNVRVYVKPMYDVGGVCVSPLYDVRVYVSPIYDVRVNDTLTLYIGDTYTVTSYNMMHTP